jgi:hypothetical protein
MTIRELRSRGHSSGKGHVGKDRPFLFRILDIIQFIGFPFIGEDVHASISI